MHIVVALGVSTTGGPEDWLIHTGIDQSSSTFRQGEPQAYLPWAGSGRHRGREEQDQGSYYQRLANWWQRRAAVRGFTKLGITNHR